MIRLLTYNIRHCLGTDGQMAPERIAEVIASCEADVVALQEVDVGRARTGVDQAEEIARLLRLNHHFHPALHLESEQYGDAILTPHRSRVVRAGALPGLVRRPGLEPRGAIWVEVEIGGVVLQVVNTHLGLLGSERVAQVNALLGADWFGHPACRTPYLLMGDLNATPWSRAYRRLAGRLTDVRRIGRTGFGRATFPTHFPLLRLDHVFVGAGIRVGRVQVIRTRLARIASDHLPLLAEIDIDVDRTSVSADRAGAVAAETR